MNLTVITLVFETESESISIRYEKPHKKQLCVTEVCEKIWCVLVPAEQSVIQLGRKDDKDIHLERRKANSSL